MVFGASGLEAFERPTERAGIIHPALPILPDGVERHPIPAGGTRSVEVFKGDEITLVDRDGMQPAEVVFFAPNGSSDLGALGLTSSASTRRPRALPLRSPARTAPVRGSRVRSHKRVLSSATPRLRACLAKVPRAARMKPASPTATAC